MAGRVSADCAARVSERMDNGIERKRRRFTGRERGSVLREWVRILLTSGGFRRLQRCGRWVHPHQSEGLQIRRHSTSPQNGDSTVSPLILYPFVFRNKEGGHFCLPSQWIEQRKREALKTYASHWQRDRNVAPPYFTLGERRQAGNYWRLCNSISAAYSPTNTAVRSEAGSKSRGGGKS